MNITEMLNNLVNKQHLTADETKQLFTAIANGEVSPAQVASMLTALRMKGETVDEITGFIQGMRQHMVRISAPDAIDVCGTGGDSSGTFNISTAVAFVVAGAGVKVAKHGNRAASSKCGSADVLEQLGVKIDLSQKQAEKVYEKTGIVFLFAPLYHPAMKYVAPVRKELGIRTVFNVLGPFANPASVSQQLIGVPNLEIAEKLSQVAKKLSYERILIVTSDDGFDEVSTMAESTMLEIQNGTIEKSTINPKVFGIKKVSHDALLGGSKEDNAHTILAVLTGTKGPKRDIVVLNSACALYAAGKAGNLKDGIALSEAAIDSGNAASALENLIKETKKYA